MVDAPVSIGGPGGDTVLAFRRLLGTVDGDTAQLMAASPFYPTASDTLPPFAVMKVDPTGSVQATTLFTPACGSTWLYRPLPLECEPELHVCSVAGGAGRQFAPAFNGEVKSAGDRRSIAQALMYVLMDLVRIFFPATNGGREPAPHAFIAKPPVGYALLAFPHVGYFLSVEWIGKLLVAPASAPFFLGSDTHKALAGALPDVHYDEPLVLTAQQLSAFVATPESPDAPQHVAWTTEGSRFYKIIRGHAYDARFFTNLYTAYAHLAELLRQAADGRPPALVSDVTLRFGAHEVLVVMPFVAGRHATDEELRSDAAVVARVAAAVAWLARRKLVYCDVRGPNVLVAADGGAFLVDYDDCFVVNDAVADVAAYKAALHSRAASRKVAVLPAPTFASELCRGALSELEAALATAFAESWR